MLVPFKSIISFIPYSYSMGKYNCFIDKDTSEFLIKSYSEFFVPFKRLTPHPSPDSYRKSRKS